MLKRPITFQDLDGNVRTQDFYFNLTLPEVTDLEVSMPGGISNYYESIVEDKDAGKLLAAFKQIVELSYGERGDDGITFYKEDPVTGRPLGRKFLQTGAYTTLFIEMFGPQASNEAFSDFIRAVIPAELVTQVEQNPNLPAAPSDETTPEDTRTIEQYSREELLAMEQVTFDKLAGTDPMKMSQPVLQVAMQRKSQAQA